jgi:hypothetical protein
LAGHHWWPAPAIEPERANAHWSTTSCATCAANIATLTATTAIPLGAPIIADHGEHILGSADNGPDVQVSFDGGKQGNDAGAGAILWTRSPGQAWRLEARARVALPDNCRIQLAEAWGLKLAVQLLSESGRRVRHAQAYGDSLPIARYGAAQGLLRNADVHALLEPVLGDLASEGWIVDWNVVTSRHNRDAHELASIARTEVAALRASGSARPFVTIERCALDSTSPPAAPAPLLPPALAPAVAPP